MTTLIKSILLACSLALCSAGAQAAEPKKPVKTVKAKAKAKPAAAPADVYLDEPEPDVANDTTTEYNCELGNKVTIYHNDTDPEHVAIRWKKRIHRLTRVGTTTGAKRFENTNFGLTWIGIPSKGMLLDSKLNRQLANECKNAEQENPIVTPVPAVTPAVTPVAAPLAAPGVAPAATPLVVPDSSVAPPVSPAVTPAVLK